MDLSALGRRVRVVVDRPMGSAHPEHGDMIYPVNYGYVPGVTGGDGEEQDVYVLGVDGPLDVFEGRVIAVIHRPDDREDKWAAAPEDARLDQAEIAERVFFQERYFHSEVYALYAHSCGVIVWRKGEDGYEFLALRQVRSGLWSLPKGGREMGESERETALRELGEECGLTAELDEEFRDEVAYELRHGRHKRVTFFLGEGRGTVRLREGEIGGAVWIRANDARGPGWHEGYADMLKRAEAYLAGKDGQTPARGS